LNLWKRLVVEERPEHSSVSVLLFHRVNVVSTKLKAVDYEKTVCTTTLQELVGSPSSSL
jgi:hypothetical protein